MKMSNIKLMHDGLSTKIMWMMRFQMSISFAVFMTHKYVINPYFDSFETYEVYNDGNGDNK